MITYSSTFGNHLYRFRIITRNNFNSYPLLFKIRQRFFGVLSNFIL